MAATDVYEALVAGSGAAFEEFYAIYADALPRREQKSRAAMAEMVLDRRYQFLLIKRDGRIAGFSVIFAAPEDAFCLLEYMAIDARDRNVGLGGALFRESIRAVAARYGDLPVLLEVDADRGLAGDASLVRRRQQFYRRLGCRRVTGLRYQLPLAGDGPPPEMDLMLYLPGPERLVRKSEMTRWLTVIYESVYGCSPEDVRLVRMARDLRDPVLFD